MITVNVVLSNGTEYTHSFDEEPENSGDQASVFKRQIAYHSKKISEVAKALSVQKKKYVNAPISIATADIKECYENIDI